LAHFGISDALERSPGHRHTRRCGMAHRARWSGHPGDRASRPRALHAAM